MPSDSKKRSAPQDPRQSVSSEFDSDARPSSESDFTPAVKRPRSIAPRTGRHAQSRPSTTVAS
ncbi:hypothetical protein BU23DRAFT_558638 [Bimuria novae-zelandiae CBS 107.79]|uniref:Uncharacterized protein n=1 Tax=Bimuria novae-zelandiae CBS 107.79 TaxID=1447943 RepID=A0A6A5UUA8_9PLEO|nr:hypothetical protein BU23DRAFT_558638 [Bimuria novae-zelandiae CBS 107.79]